MKRPSASPPASVSSSGAAAPSAKRTFVEGWSPSAAAGDVASAAEAARRAGHLHVPYPEVGAVLGAGGDEVAPVGAPRQVRYSVRVTLQ